VGATQFALPAALELMRSLTDPPEEAETVVLAATDPANPFGTMLKWPSTGDGESSGARGPTRSVGSLVVLVNGALAAYVARGGRQLLAFLPDDEPVRTIAGRALAVCLAKLARTEEGRGGLLISEINGIPAADHPFASFLADSGFSPSAMGLQMRKPRPAAGSLAIAGRTPLSIASARSDGRGSGRA